MNLTEKLFALRKEIKPMKKDKQGYNYKYFDINQMIEVLQPLFEKYNLLVTQPLGMMEGRMTIRTQIIDIESENILVSETPLIELQDPQKMGGCITYFRRYALQSLFFLEAEDDDATQTKGVPTKSETTAKAYAPRKFTNEESPF